MINKLIAILIAIIMVFSISPSLYVLANNEDDNTYIDEEYSDLAVKFENNIHNTELYLNNINDIVSVNVKRVVQTQEGLRITFEYEIYSENYDKSTLVFIGDSNANIILSSRADVKDGKLYINDDVTNSGISTYAYDMHCSTRICEEWVYDEWDLVAPKACSTVVGQPCNNLLAVFPPYGYIGWLVCKGSVYAYCTLLDTGYRCTKTSYKNVCIS